LLEQNQAANEQFVLPKPEEYQIPDLSEKDIDAIALNLNSMEQKQQNNLIIKLLSSLI